MENKIPDLNMLKEVSEKLGQIVHNTPILTSSYFDQLSGSRLFFKCENFQKVGAFKYRGATNAILNLSDEERSRGVATHSSGNHAQAVALAAKMNNIKAFIVMPENASKVKKYAVAGYGAEVIECKPTLQSREDSLRDVMNKTGAVLIHPYNDYRIIAGQATAAIELMKKVDKLEVIMAPVGGGGLISGTALAAHYLSPETKVIAGEPEGADDAQRSLSKGEIVPSENPDTIADGLLTSLGDKTFGIIKDHVKEIITVSDEEIIQNLKLVWERMKIVIEPSAAVPLAALIKEKDRFTGQKIGIILSGGNVDLDKLPF